HINTSRLWGGSGRPGSFRKSTLKKLSEKFSDKHVHANGKVTTRVLPGNDRRHIKAFSTIREDYQLALNGKSFDEAKKFLGSRGQKPRATNESVEAATKVA